MKYFLKSLALLMLAFTSCHSQADLTCPFPYTAYTDGDRSGFLTVPLDRSQPDGPTTQLAYLVIQSKSEKRKPDPIVFLQGGPGGLVLALADPMSQLGTGIDPDRDFILFDQRGVGYSDPICPEAGQIIADLFAKDLDIKMEASQLVEQLETCKNSIQEEGRSIAHYGSKENAADLEDLRVHLGYEQWNLLGGSYGTRLAMTYMDLYKNAVRSATLISVFPPQVRMYDHLISNFDRSLQKVFVSCANDPSCVAKYPDIKTVFYEVLTDLEDTPFSYEVNRQPYVLNKQDFLLFLQQMLYDRYTIAGIPAFIHAVKDRDKTQLAISTQVLLQRLQILNLGVYWSVMAEDEGAYDNQAKLDAELDRLPDYAPGISLFASDPTVIADWAASNEQTEKLYVGKSDLPTLLINGDFDPITPPVNAEKALDSLPNAHLSIIPYAGHTPFSPCLFEIIRTFLEHPEQAPKDGCKDAVTGFEWR